jgi:hypothetical protein
MRKWRVVFLLLLVGLIIPAPVQAKPPASFESMEVDLWPEYDQPSMLVIYRITLDPATTLPADVTLHIPVNVGDPSAVATRETNGQLLNLAYTRTIQGEWSAISFKSTAYQIQFEYYDPGLVKNGSTRNFTYTWAADYAVKALTLQVQQPVGASQMTLSPDLGNPITSATGLAYYDATVGAVAAGTQFKLSIQYQKNTDALSQPTQPVQASETLGPTTAGRTQSPSLVILVLVGLAAILFIASIYILLRSNKIEITFGENKRHKTHKRLQDEGNAAPQEGIFCHQCGKRAAPGDVFCRACGTQLRKE